MLTVVFSRQSSFFGMVEKVFSDTTCVRTIRRVNIACIYRQVFINLRKPDFFLARARCWLRKLFFFAGPTLDLGGAHGRGSKAREDSMPSSSLGWFLQNLDASRCGCNRFRDPTVDVCWRRFIWSHMCVELFWCHFRCLGRTRGSTEANAIAPAATAGGELIGW